MGAEREYAAYRKERRNKVSMRCIERRRERNWRMRKERRVREPGEKRERQIAARECNISGGRIEDECLRA